MPPLPGRSFFFTVDLRQVRGDSPIMQDRPVAMPRNRDQGTRAEKSASGTPAEGFRDHYDRGYGLTGPASRPFPFADGRPGSS